MKIDETKITMKRYLLISSLLVFSLSYVQSQKITNVRSEQNGQKIVVSYDLSGKADISLTMKANQKKLPVTRISGDVGKRINKGNDRRIVWDVLSEYPDGFEADSVVFTVKATPVWRTFLIAEGAVSPAPLQGSGGIMIGRVARWGYYAKFRSSFMFAPSNDGKFTETSIDITVTKSDIEKLITGNKKNTELICNVGAIYNFSMNTDYPMFVYAGIGYGMRRQMWKFKDDSWLKYDYTAYEGVSVDLGLMFTLKNFTFDIGANTINFEYAEIQFGIGWLFNK